MFKKEVNELMKQAFVDYANELEENARRWETEHPEKAAKRHAYWDAHQEEFERELLAKIKERQCE